MRKEGKMSGFEQEPQFDIIAMPGEWEENNEDDADSAEEQQTEEE
jgi:hypothetical protein